MPTGLKIPVRVDQRGRAAVETDEGLNLVKILILALSEGGDNNPFQDLGIDLGLIFSIKNASFRGRATRAITLVLDKYKEFVRLDDSSPLLFDDSIEGEVEVSFKYIDLLTGRENEFIQVFKRT